MKKIAFILLYIIFFSTLFSESHIDQKKSIAFRIENTENTNTCTLISSTVNENLQFIFSQVASYIASNDETGNSDIDIITTVKSVNNSFIISTKCIQNGNLDNSFTIESNKFDLLDAFSEADNIGIRLLNKLSESNYSLQKVIINNGLIPQDINVYLDDVLIKPSDLNHILSGSYHLKIAQTINSNQVTILDLNPLIVSNNHDTLLSIVIYPSNNNNNSNTQLLSHNSYISEGYWSAFPDWNNDWSLSNRGQTIIKFRAKAERDIFVGFATSQSQDSIKYQLDIGGWYNTKSVLRRYTKYYMRDGDAAVALYSDYAIKKENDYWIIFDKNNNTIAFGYGDDYTKNRVIFYRSKKSLSDIMFFSFSSWDKPVEYSDISVLNE